MGVVLTPEFDYHESWAPVLEPALEAAWPSIGPVLERDDFLPPREDIFRAFRIPMDAVRVLIVGQDPYPTPGNAMGMSFSTRPGVKPPRSLVNIYKELRDDVGVTPPRDGDLTAWSDQGVMLLNRVLTVRSGDAGSHRRIGWEVVTEAAMRALNRPQMVAILWGRDAQKCKRFIPDVPTIESSHPSPLGARYSFFGSRPFSRANAFLRDQGAAPVNWQL